MAHFPRLINKQFQFFEVIQFLELKSRDREVAPTAMCRESKFPPTEELNVSVAKALRY